MSELDRLAKAAYRFEEATGMVRDLLSEKNRDRLIAAIKTYGKATVEELEASMRFMDWLVFDETHLDAMLADTHDIDLSQADRERGAAQAKMLLKIHRARAQAAVR